VIRGIRVSVVFALVLAFMAVASPALAVTVSGAVTNADPTSQGRPSQDGSNSSCVTPQPYPGTANETTPYHHDAITFSNTSASPQCVTVQTTIGSGPTGKVAAYSPSFNPADPSENFVGHVGFGFSGDTVTFSFAAAAATTFVVVVTESEHNQGVPSYSLNVTGTGVALGLVVSGAVTNADPTSQGRPVVGGENSNSTCANPHAYPGTSQSTTGFHHDARPFTNTTGSAQCVTVKTTIGSGTSGKVAAYSPSFNPADPSQNFVGDVVPNFSGNTQTFSFVATAGATFVVVVFENSANAGVAAYTIQVTTDPVAAVCSRIGSTLSVEVPNGASATIGRSGSDLSVTGPGIADSTCGGATVTNIDSIAVTGDGGAQALTVDLSGGRLGPGATAEPSGTSEIEVSVDLGAGADTFALKGGAGDDTFRFGTTGVKLNGDSDNDITLAGVDSVTVEGGPGDDVYAAPAVPDGATTFIGGSGIDAASYGLRTAGVKVLLDNVANDGGSGGAEGDDIRSSVEKVTAGKGKDLVDAVAQSAANTFKGLAGNDTLRGRLGRDTLIGGDGSDVLEGGDGNDTVNTRDGISGNDTARGGSGTDICRTDPGDTRSGCES
jgi:Ca2+-binding RTX toxin-like protein